MTVLCVRRLGALRPLAWLAAAVFLACLAERAVAAEPIVVRLDQARVFKLPERATTVVIGDPLIADLSIQPGGLAVVTGKSYGATNVIVMDRGGAVLMENQIEVKGPVEATVVVYRGISRQTYSCLPDCEPRVTLGDTGKDDFDDKTGLYTDFFGKTLGQSSARNSQAMTAGAGGAR
jgi:hypothetical protein